MAARWASVAGAEEAVHGGGGVVRGAGVERGGERVEEARRGRDLLPRGDGDVEERRGELRGEQGHGADDGGIEPSRRRWDRAPGERMQGRRKEKKSGTHRLLCRIRQG
jgi:hypothetical protein